MKTNQRILDSWLPETRVLVFGLLIGLLLRLFCMYFFVLNTESDAAGYLMGGENILNHGVYSMDPGGQTPGMFRPPLYSAFIAGVFSVFGYFPRAIQLIQIFIGLLVCLLLYIAIAPVSKRVASLVFLLEALLPFDMMYQTLILSETLSLFLIVAAFVCAFRLEGLWRWMGIGLFLGLLCLCRDVYLPMIPMIALAWLFFGNGSFKRRMSHIIILFLFSGVMITPWVIRNSLLAHKPVLLSEGRLGWILFTGTWVTTDTSHTYKYSSDGKYLLPPIAFYDDQARDELRGFLKDNDYKKWDKELLQVALRRIKEEPFTVIGRWFVRAPLYWLGTRSDLLAFHPTWTPRGSPQWVVLKSGLWMLNFVVVLLGVLGMFLAISARSILRWYLIPVIFTVIVHLPLFVEFRCTQPVYFCMVIFCAFFVLKLREIWSGYESSL